MVIYTKDGFYFFFFLNGKTCSPRILGPSHRRQQSLLFSLSLPLSSDPSCRSNIPYRSFPSSSSSSSSHSSFTHLSGINHMWSMVAGCCGGGGGGGSRRHRHYNIIYCSCIGDGVPVPSIPRNTVRLCLSSSRRPFDVPARFFLFFFRFIRSNFWFPFRPTPPTLHPLPPVYGRTKGSS